MRSVLVSAAMLGVVHVTFAPAMAGPTATVGSNATDRATSDGEGADGGRGRVLVRAGSAPLLAPADARQSLLVAVGEGGEGGRGGKRGRRWGRHYGYPAPHYFRAVRYPPYGWTQPECYRFAPPPPAYRLRVTAGMPRRRHTPAPRRGRVRRMGRPRELRHLLHDDRLTQHFAAMVPSHLLREAEGRP